MLKCSGDSALRFPEISHLDSVGLELFVCYLFICHVYAVLPPVCFLWNTH